MKHYQDGVVSSQRLPWLAAFFLHVLSVVSKALLAVVGVIVPTGSAKSPTSTPFKRGAQPASHGPGVMEPLGGSCLPKATTPASDPAEQPAEEAALPGAEQQQSYPEGYSALAEHLRQTDFQRLAGKVYADYAGAPPYADSLLRQSTEDLLRCLHGNPHSAYGWAEHASEAAAQRVRQLTLAMCRADPQQYECVLTSGATGALRLVGESFPWGPCSTFLHLRDNHNSVLGIRQLAAQRGARSAAVEVTAFGPELSSSSSGSSIASEGAAGAAGASVPALTLRICSPGSCLASSGTSEGGSAASNSASGGEQQPCHLFALPLESNMWGVRYEQGLVGSVQQGHLAVVAGDEGEKAGPPPATERWRVLLDAAKGCASCPPDLSRHPADFVALSYYKLFGYPTGLGALVVRRDALQELLASKAYFGGGTVAVSLAEEQFFRRRPGAAGLEDGTLPFLQLPAVLQGFAFLERCGGLPAIGAHAAAVARRLVERLTAARHHNGSPMVEVYGAWPGAQGLVQQQQQQHLQAAFRQRAMQRTQVLRHGRRRARVQSESQEDEVPAACGALAAATPPSSPGSARSAPKSSRSSEGWASAPSASMPCKSACESACESCAGSPRALAGTGVQPLQSQHLQQLAQQGVAGQGPVVAFNVLRPDGSYVGYREVEKLGSLHGIFLRTGCMCNPGACAQALGLSAADMKANYEAGHVCWDDNDIIGGRPTGVVRASFGYASTLADADAIAAFVEKYFLEAEAEAGAETVVEGEAGAAAAAGPRAEAEGTPGKQGAALHATSPLAAALCVARRPSPPPAPLTPPAAAGEGAAPAAFFQPAAAAGSKVAALEAPVPALPSLDLPAWPGSSATLPAATQRLDTAVREATPPMSSRAELCRVTDRPCQQQQQEQQEQQAGSGGSGGLQLESIFVYPIKSCRGMQAQAWPLGPTGLLFDRHWVLVDGSGAALTLRKYPGLATIQPHIDLQAGLLRVNATGLPDSLELPLPPLPASVCRAEPAEVANEACSSPAAGTSSGSGSGVGTSSSSSSGHGSRGHSSGSGSGSLSSIRVCSREECAQQVAVASGDAEAVSAWFERALGVPCRLVQQLSGGAGSRGSQALQPKGGAEAGSSSSSTGEGSRDGSSSSSSSSSSRDGGGAEPQPQPEQLARPSLPAPAPARSFANEAQFLVVSSASLADLHARVTGAGRAGSQGVVSTSCTQTPAVATAAGVEANCGPGSSSLAAFTQRFRPNLVLGGTGTAAQPYCEDGWERVVVGGVALRSAGGCPRCDMVCMDPLTGRREGPEPLLTLAGYRRQRGAGGGGKGGGGGKICFGVKFNQEQQEGAEAAGPAALASPAGSKGAAATQLEWVTAQFRRCLAVGMPACME